MKLMLSMAFAASILASPSFAKEGGRPDVYTTRILHMKGDVSYEQAKKTLEALNPVLNKAKGFEKRNLFYDAEKKVWIDQIKWKHIDAAKASQKILDGDPAFTSINKMLDEKATLQFQGERILEFNAPK